MSVEKQLQAMRVHSSDARKVFDALRSYENNVDEISVDTLQGKTKGMQPAAIRAVLAELQQLGLGELIWGRKGKSTRFRWHQDFVGIFPGPAAGESKNGGRAVLPDGAAMNQFVCALGGKREAHLFLPALLSDSDLKKVRRFVERLISPAD